MDQAETLLKIMKEKQFNTNHGDTPYTGPRIITVSSGKGGVGKTNVATNLAIGFVKMGKEVVLMDADLGLANVNVILGIIPKYNLYNVLKGQKSLSEIITDTPEGVKIIAGASGFSQLADLNHDQRIKFISEVEKLSFADLIIIDTGAGVSDNVLSFVLAAEEIIIVTTPEPTAITDAYGIIKTIANKQRDSNIKLIINRVQSHAEADSVANRVINIAQKFLGMKVESIGYIYEDPSVPKAVIQQKPFVSITPNAKASQCITKICFRLEHLDVPKQKKGFAGFFKNFFQYYQDNQIHG